ncbi:MAG: hypothetical protein R3B40_08205 [Polyangiales bacterium]|nr:hypothetical protein [Myxococcales bacterium]MCB9660731.1 hypothetical protein [Sandaracinaceae bacterium]
MLLLVELRCLVMRPSLDAENPRRVLDAYAAFIASRFPGTPSAPLYERMRAGKLDEQGFVGILQGFHDGMLGTILEENPFEHSELALRFSFAKGQPPAMTACTAYYESFRRAVRSLSAPPDKAGRKPSKPIENATDFTLEDARVRAANGSPATVLFRLAAPGGQVDYDANEHVRHGLGHVATIAEWADTTDGMDGLALDDMEVRTHAALQTLRLLPSRGIASVEVGGLAMGRAKPVTLRPTQERRMMSVVAERADEEPFEHRDEIRAIDLDRGFIKLGHKPSVVCYASPELLEDVQRVGVVARVVGKRLSPRLGKAPFVVASSIEHDEPLDDA